MNDFKSRLLDYLLGNINKSIGINEPNLTLNEYTNGYNSYIVSNIKNINSIVIKNNIS